MGGGPACDCRTAVDCCVSIETYIFLHERAEHTGAIGAVEKLKIETKKEKQVRESTD